MSFLHTLSSLMCTRGGLSGQSPIDPSQARLTLEFFRDGLLEKKLQLVGRSILSILLSLGLGCILTPLRRSTSSLINPQPGTFSLYHVCVSSVSACAMLCDHSGPTSAMRTMPVQLLPTWAPWNRRVGFDTICNVPPIRRSGPPTLGSSLVPQEYPHIPTHVFSAHFVLTHAPPGRTSQSVSHRSKTSTLYFGGFLRWASRKEVAIVGRNILLILLSLRLECHMNIGPQHDQKEHKQHTFYKLHARS
jgi:hypothetical protein